MKVYCSTTPSLRPPSHERQASLLELFGVFPGGAETERGAEQNVDERRVRPLELVAHVLIHPCPGRGNTLGGLVQAVPQRDRDELPFARSPRRRLTLNVA